MQSTLKAAYIPIDRALALTGQLSIPPHVTGTALFADISGFSLMTERLRIAFGDREGAELLILTLNQVFTELIGALHLHGGAVIGFSGDAITCWFDATYLGGEEAAAHQAVTTAYAMHLAMQQGNWEADAALEEATQLSMKASLASGTAKRFIVGNPNIQLQDVLVGDVITRMAMGEKLASTFETLADEATIALLGDKIAQGEWREKEGQRFNVIETILMDAAPRPWENANTQLDDEVTSQWLLPAVDKHLSTGVGQYLTQLREVVALFMGFDGLDYQHDEQVSDKLNTFFNSVQKIIDQYGGSIIQLTFGDKGSYLYAVFGAPNAHEDSANRAVSAAIDLRDKKHNDSITVRMGLSRGVMRTGAYGSDTRRTYGVQGDEVNLAARLMQHADIGNVIVSENVVQPTKTEFDYDEPQLLTVKGKNITVRVAHLLDRKYFTMDTIAINQRYTTALIGREQEMALLTEFVQPALDRQFTGLMYVFGEAGIGKTRLVAELRRDLRRDKHVTWISLPASETLMFPYGVFAYGLRSYFNQRTGSSKNHETFNNLYNDLSISLEKKGAFFLPVRNNFNQARPYIGTLVGLGDNSPRQQNSSFFRELGDALINFLRGLSLIMPLMLEIEDCHYLDFQSSNLIDDLLQATNNFGGGIILTSRYADNGDKYYLPLSVDVPIHTLELKPLQPDGTQRLVGFTLGAEASDKLGMAIHERTDGNPLFVEQVALDLKERGKVAYMQGIWDILNDVEMGLPDEVTRLLITRLDRLPADVKAVVQAASVQGNRFDVRVLSEMLWQADTTSLVLRGQIAGIWSEAQAPYFAFKNRRLRDAAYAMQTQVDIRERHRQIAETIERIYPYDQQQALILAQHWHYAGEPEREERHLSIIASRFLDNEVELAEVLSYVQRSLVHLSITRQRLQRITSWIENYMQEHG